MGKLKEDIDASVYDEKTQESVEGLMKHFMEWPGAKTMKAYLQSKLEEFEDQLPENAITRLQPLIQI